MMTLNLTRLFLSSQTSVNLSQALVEKDYWVTHALWALQQSGLEVWFKGGTTGPQPHTASGGQLEEHRQGRNRAAPAVLYVERDLTFADSSVQ